MVEACREALREAMLEDESVFILGEDIGDAEGGGTFKVTKGLSTEFGTGRVRTTPISEQAIVGAAIGAAIAGMRPVAEIMLMNFITVAMDQIVNHAAKLRYMSGGETSVPITIRTATGAGNGTGAQHSDMLEAWFGNFKMTMLKRNFYDQEVYEDYAAEGLERGWLERGEDDKILWMFGMLS